MEWIFTGNIARIGKKYEILDSLGERARVLTYLREALSSIAYGQTVPACTRFCWVSPAGELVPVGG
jgi:hypothetical protein